MRLRRPDPHTLAGAYALDAVAGADRARFERHLAGCQACARELRGLRETTARLAGAVAVEPSAELVAQVLAAAARMPQLPPTTGPAGRWQRTRHAGAAAGRMPVPRPARPALLPRLALALAAVFLAVAVGSGAVAVSIGHRLGQAQQRDHVIAEVLGAPDAVMLTARVTTGGKATVVMSRRDRALVFTANGLPPLGSGQCYQLWLMGPGGERSAGLLPAPRQGMTGPVIATGLAAGDWVGLTVEPASGAPRPAARPVLMLNLAT